MNLNVRHMIGLHFKKTSLNLLPVQTALAPLDIKSPYSSVSPFQSLPFYLGMIMWKFEWFDVTGAECLQLTWHVFRNMVDENTTGKLFAHFLRFCGFFFLATHTESITMSKICCLCRKEWRQFPMTLDCWTWEKKKGGADSVSLSLTISWIMSY